MKKLLLKSFLIIGTVVVTFTSCTTVNKNMREPNSRVNFNKSDFALSDQVTAEAQTTKYFGIDFSRLFLKNTGNIEGGAGAISLSSIPVVGNLVGDKTTNYSLYQLMVNNPGYDVVFYPQYEIKVVKPILGLGFLTKVITVKTTARLGKLNK